MIDDNAESGRKPEIPHREIALRAYQIWTERGCTHGFDSQDWLQAEQDLMLKYC
ncbi:DUF2934 domain-containing protein [bacterium]|nr:DUF2934 domain-containing protein [bacterium]QQR60179.1 MAG: DUF2934 domain-containing protein [Candidatus Melainabacteria bacterium]